MYHVVILDAVETSGVEGNWIQFSSLSNLMAYTIVEEGHLSHCIFKSAKQISSYKIIMDNVS